MVDWTQLPREILESIFDLLDSVGALRFRSVCSAWRNAVSITAHGGQSIQSEFARTNSLLNTLFGFTISRRRIFLLSSSHADHIPHSPSDASNVSSIYAVNCSNPWIIKTEEIQPGIFHILHPFSRTLIDPLPRDFPTFIDLSNVRVCELGLEYVLRYNERPLSGDLGDFYRGKVAYLLRNDGEFLLSAIHVCGKLGIFKSVDLKWTVIEDDLHYPYDDVVAFYEDIYAVNNEGWTVKVDFDSNNDAVLTLVATRVYTGGYKKRLASSMGRDLLMVDVHKSCLPFEEKLHFDVFKLDRHGKTWVKIYSLGDQILCLGDICAFSTSASNLGGGWEGNCICFMDMANHSSTEMDYCFKCHNVRVFNLDNKELKYLCDCPDYCKLFWPPPSWLGSVS